KRSALTADALRDTGPCHKIEVLMSRPPIGDRPMTAAERKRRQRERESSGGSLLGAPGAREHVASLPRRPRADKWVHPRSGVVPGGLWQPVAGLAQRHEALSRGQGRTYAHAASGRQRADATGTEGRWVGGRRSSPNARFDGAAQIKNALQ